MPRLDKLRRAELVGRALLRKDGELTMRLAEEYSVDESAVILHFGN